MRAFRFVHAADLHLDSPFKGIGGRLPDAIRRRVRDATLSAFDRLVQLCIREQVDFLLIAGDVYDLADRSLRAQTYFHKGVCQLHEYGIHVYVCHGNHDPDDGRKMTLTWPDNVHFFSAEKVESVSHIKAGREVARIYGRSYPAAKFTERIVDRYERAPDVPFAIGLLHTNLDGNPAHDNYAPCSKRDLIASGFDYWALGHIHRGGVIEKRDPCIVYAGNTQGRHVQESGAKGCYVVDVVDGEIRELTFHETDVVRWYEKEIDLTGAEKIQHVLDAVQDELHEIADELEQRAAVVRFCLTGETAVHHQLKPVEHLLDLLEPYLEDYMQLDDWVYVESFRVNTRPAISREARLNNHGFLADYLQLVEEAANSSDQLAVLRDDVLRDVFNHREGRKHLNPPTDEEMRELLEEVKDVVIRLFDE